MIVYNAFMALALQYRELYPTIIDAFEEYWYGCHTPCSITYMSVVLSGISM